MKKILKEKLAMSEAVLQVLNKFVNLITGTAFKRKKDELEKDIRDIVNLEGTQDTVTNGVVANKADLREKLLNLTQTVQGALVAYALEKDMVQLYEEVSFTGSELMYCIDTIFSNRCQLILDRAKENLAGLSDFDIDDAVLIRHKATLDVFVAAIGSSKMSRSLRRSATTNLVTAIRNMEETLEACDGLMQPYKATQPNFYEAYLSARRIDSLPGRSQSLVASILDAETGKPIYLATALVSGTNETGTSTEAGTIIFSGLDYGFTSITISANGYEHQTIEGLIISPGEIARVSVKLKRTQAIN